MREQLEKNAIKYIHRFVRAAIDKWHALLAHVLPVVMQFPPPPSWDNSIKKNNWDDRNLK